LPDCQGETRWIKEMINIQSTLPVDEAARFLGLSRSTLAKLRLIGNGPAYCKLGRRVVYRPSDLEAWLKARVTQDTSDANTRFLQALTAERRR
jgi:excisionase family DNA binding protein